jgi:predicted AAA+ superfamily ATPase
MYDYEIDFVAEKERERHYLQVSYLLETPDTLERDLRPLRAVDDQWPKTLLSLDEFRPRVFEGIRHHSIFDFLMGAGI